MRSAKCKQFIIDFLVIVDALEENKRLKLEVAKNEDDKKSIEAMHEMIESLTQKKLADATTIEELNKQISLKEKSLNEFQNKLTAFNEASIENEALKRQLLRLQDENDSLLSQLESMESSPTAQSAAASEELQKQVEKLNDELLTLAKQYEEKANETRSLKDLTENNSSKIKKLIQENSDLKSSLESQNDKTPSDQVKIKYDKCIKKLKLYREKLIEISESFKLLKSDRQALISNSREYSNSVTQWQEEITRASLKMIESLRDSNKQLRSKDEEIEQLKNEVESLKTSSVAVASSQASSQASSETLVKDLEAEIQKLKDVVKSKDKSLEEEKEAQKKLKQAVKKTSVLDLEMEAYEKTLDELNKKLEAKKVQVTELENTIKMQTDTMESLKSQITSLEANMDAEKAHSAEVKKNLDAQLSALRKTEHERTEANLQLELLNKNHEALKLETSEAKLEMAKHVGDLEKRYQSMESDRNDLLKNVTFLECEVDKFRKLASNHEKEVENLRAEFSGYKIRAQSVLRQGQTKDFGKEQELQDEIATLQKAIEASKDSNNKITHELESLKKHYNDIADDKLRLQNRCKDLLEAMEKQSDEVLEESRKRNQQHEESIKAYQLQIDTLNAFYKKKIQEADENNSSAMTELKEKISKLEKASALASSLSVQSVYESNMYQIRSEEQKMSMLMIDREEAEGSEDQSSLSSAFHPQHRRKISKGRELMPLDELLNSSFDDNSNEINEETISNYSSPSEILEQTKAKLAKEESRVSHLTGLLADSEKDLAKMQQMNDMLKEEVRRQQRNFDREEHIKNSEYLKNVVVKFVTLTNGDEKQRLIPVLNTILRLSSEENNLLLNACKGGFMSGLWAK